MKLPWKSSGDRSYFTPEGRVLAWITRTHRALYRATGGLVGGALVVPSEPGSRFPLRTMQVLLLTTTGRKTGLARTVPLPYFADAGRTFVVASNSGSDRHPAWLSNLEQRAEAEVQIGAVRAPARAVVLDGDDRERVWSRITAEWPRYRVYQEGTSRRIPLVELVLSTPAGR